MTPATPIPRDPASVLARLHERWGRQADVWIFGYASLIWRPEFAVAESRPAVVHGWHRALRMHSRVNRGTPQRPGLVFALLAGGSCRGVVYRLPRRGVLAELEGLWLREMPNAVYDPRWLAAATPQGTVAALAFTLSRRSPSWTGPIDDERMLQILRHAQGRYGSTLDYLVHTAHALRACGVHDAQVERLLRLARSHGLVGASEP